MTHFLELAEVVTMYAILAISAVGVLMLVYYTLKLAWEYIKSIRDL